MTDTPATAIRPSAVAGSWYPGSPATLGDVIDRLLAAAEPPPVPGRVVGLVSPHAGLRYSGPVAAHGYGLLAERPGLTVVLVGPCHRDAFPRVALWARGGFETPLGTIPVDAEVAEAIRAADPAAIERNEDAHRREHSLEMQLPFLQRVVPGLRIVPLLMGSQARPDAEALARALAAGLAGRDVVLVASSDLSHYHPAAVAQRLDAEVVGDIERLDGASLMARLERDPQHACGGGPMVAVLEACAALGADRATILRYAHSGEVGERDESQVVGYVSAALSRS